MVTLWEESQQELARLTSERDSMALSREEANVKIRELEDQVNSLTQRSSEL